MKVIFYIWFIWGALCGFYDLLTTKNPGPWYAEIINMLIIAIFSPLQITVFWFSIALSFLVGALRGFIFGLVYLFTGYSREMRE